MSCGAVRVLMLAVSLAWPVWGQDAALAEQVRELLVKHDLAGARGLLQQTLRNGAANAGTYNLLGIVEAQAGNYRASEAAFRKAIQLQPSSVPSYENLGRLYQEHTTEDPEAAKKAIANYRVLVNLQPGNEEGNFQLARLLALEGSYAESSRFLGRVSGDTAGQPPALGVRVIDCAGLKKDCEAATAALASHPALTEEDVISISAALERAGGRRENIVLFEALRRRNLASPGALRSLAALYEQDGRLQEARDTFESSARGRLDVEVLLALARIAFKQQDYQGALGYAAHARDFDNKDSRPPFVFGVTALQMNLPAEAEKSLSTALELDPANARAHYALGMAMAALGRPDEALVEFKAYAAANPADPRGALLLGAAYFQAGDDDAAASPLQQATRTPATAAAAHYYLGRIAARRGDSEAALGEYKLAIAANPELAGAFAEIGSIQLDGGETEAARQWIERALAIDPRHHRANLYLLKLYRKSRDPRAAEQEARFKELQAQQFDDFKLMLRVIRVQPN